MHRELGIMPHYFYNRFWVAGGQCGEGMQITANLSSDNLTSFYGRYLAPTHRARIERLHRAGVKCAVHLDGTVAGLLPKLVASGFDAVEALTPKPIGDLSAQEMAHLAGGDEAILWRGVPGAMFAPPHSWDDMARHVTDTLDC